MVKSVRVCTFSHPTHLREASDDVGVFDALHEQSHVLLPLHVVPEISEASARVLQRVLQYVRCSVRCSVSETVQLLLHIVPAVFEASACVLQRVLQCVLQHVRNRAVASARSSTGI